MGYNTVDTASGEKFQRAPQANKIVMHLPGNKTFTMRAENLSRENKYVKSVSWNGTPLEGFIIRHADIMKGGELIFEMTDQPVM